ncbi:MAG TPA: hypothetical protein VGJ37_07545 [Pyrinomonadaceae bacterium]|jgi:hypothetical protein
MNFIVLGQIGSDAGYWYLGPDGKWHHVGGWGVEKFVDVSRSLDILSQAAKLKTPGIAETVTRGLSEFVNKELTGHLGDRLKGGGVVIIKAGG